MPDKPRASVGQRRFVDVVLDNFDSVLEACRPHLSLRVANKLSDDESQSLQVELSFRSFKDFDPEEVARQVRPLRELLDLRSKLANLRTTLQGNEKLDKLLQEVSSNPQKLHQLQAEVSPAPPAPETPARNTPHRETLRAEPPERGIWSSARATEQPSIIDQVAEVMPGEAPGRETTRDLVREFVTGAAEGNAMGARDSEAMINQRIAQIDHLISLQLAEVLHSAEFQTLESTWRGLHFLLRRTRKAAHVQIRVLNVNKKELLTQFQRGRGRHESSFARKVLDHVAGTQGVAPLGLMIGGFAIGRHPEDVELMERMAQLCAAAHVPFLASAAPELLGVSNFNEIVDAFELHQIFHAIVYAKWTHFSARVESRYTGLTLPRMLLRLPYGRDGVRVEAFEFEEGVDGSDASRLLWGSAGWAFAARCAGDFERYGWFGSRRADDDPGDIRDLPVFAFRTDDGDIATIGPAEIAVSEARYGDFRALGLIPLCGVSGADRAEFLETRSCHRPHTDPDSDPPTTYESAEMDCMLAVSYLAHCVQFVLREQRQHLSTVHEMEEYLRRWAAPLIAPEYAKGTSIESSFPLLSAKFHIELGSEPRKPASVMASLIPTRAIGVLPGPVEIAIPIALPLALGWRSDERPPDALPISAASMNGATAELSEDVGGREQFIRRLYMAEGCITNNKLDIAILILEELAEQIDRHHLEEWESSRLVTQVWDLLRRCYLLRGTSSPGALERSEVLLRRICRLDPARAIQ